MENLPIIEGTRDIGAFENSQSFEHSQRVAKMLSASSLIPKEFQNNIQNVMIALEMSHRIGASPLMVMQNIYIVHGKPTWSSAFIIATINATKKFTPLRFDISGEGDDYGCIAWALDSATNERVEGVKVTIKMAKDEGWYNRSGSKWKTMPDLMLRYRAATLFGRLYTPEILMGMHTSDEITDITHVVKDSGIEIEEIQSLYTLKYDAIPSDAIEDIERIIKKEEKSSYPKLLTYLKSL